MNSPSILPGAVIGILGSGQLGRMTAIAAAQLGYRVHCYSPDQGTPAGFVCEKEWVGAYEDVERLAQFASSCQIVTYEFENVPLVAASTIESLGKLAPSSAVLSTCQDRLDEKNFLRSHAIPVPDFLPIRSVDELDSIPKSTKFPAVLKTARLGYDGKGQGKANSQSEVRTLFESFGQVPCILESYIDFRIECSVIVARNAIGEVALYPTIENHHSNHILDISVAPARVSASVHNQAQQIARTIADKLSLVGILAVELFVTHDDRVLVNELAPRPHNSGHLTIEACTCSQFQQVIRAICNLPLGNTSLRSAAGMANLLGDIWKSGEPNWPGLLREPDLSLHLYGKQEARPDRKMGHLTLIGETPDTIENRLRTARSKLTR